MAAAVERIVVQATPQEKKTITAKAKRLGLPISELMRRGATAYESSAAEEELGALADAARVAADRASDAIDDALQFVDASNKRIALLEARSTRARSLQLADARSGRAHSTRVARKRDSRKASR